MRKPTFKISGAALRRLRIQRAFRLDELAAKAHVPVKLLAAMEMQEEVSSLALLKVLAVLQVDETLAASAESMVRLRMRFPHLIESVLYLLDIAADRTVPRGEGESVLALTLQDYCCWLLLQAELVPGGPGPLLPPVQLH